MRVSDSVARVCRRIGALAVSIAWGISPLSAAQVKTTSSPWSRLPSGLSRLKLSDRIVAVPTIVLFDRGREVWRVFGWGAAQRHELSARLRAGPMADSNAATPPTPVGEAVRNSAPRNANAVVATLRVSPTSVTSMWGATVSPTVSALDSAGRAIANPALTWSSSDTAVASVDATGRVTLRRRGTATITIASAGVTTALPVTVQGFRTLAATTEEFTCALPDEPTRIYCWGYGPRLPFPQLTQQQVNPLPIRAGAAPAETRFAQIVLSAFHGCALTTTGTLFCFGTNAPAVGNADGLAHPDWAAVADGDKPAGARWTSVAVSPSNTCAIADERELYCWGTLNASVGAGRRTASQPARTAQGGIPAGARLTAVTTSINGGCVVANGLPYCWISSPRAYVYGPTAVPTGDLPQNVTLTAIASDDFTCALGSDGRAYCWGAAFGRRFGQATAAFQNAPEPHLVSAGAVPTGVTLVQLTLGGIANVACGRGSDSTAYCWGLSHNGSAGDGVSVAEHDVLAPTPVVRGEIPADVRATDISCGKYHCAMIGDDGRIYSWGSNQFSQLGRSSQGGMKYAAPILIAPPVSR
jgi:alpha-tubulin suppressor-like RCC1 family protein